MDAIVSGAGLPLELPGLVERADVALAPIVSSGRAAKLILRRWAKAFNRTADFVVIEGCKAGGHLAFGRRASGWKMPDSRRDPAEVLAEVKPFEAQFGHDIPVFVAGGVYTGEDIAHYTKMGAAGAQLATRFIPTYECDASQTYKDVLLAAKPKDVRIITALWECRAVRWPLRWCRSLNQVCASRRSTAPAVSKPVSRPRCLTASPTPSSRP